MKRILLFYAFILITILILGFWHRYKSPEKFTYYIVNPHKDSLALFWKNDEGKQIRSFENLSVFTQSKNKKLIFAMNGGIYMKNGTPLGIYINNHTIEHPININKNGEGNFYLQPNGIFYITNDLSPLICKTENFPDAKNIKYATQSGPLLLIDSIINPLFNKESCNTNIRNGVGILPNNQVVFIISNHKVNFYEFAAFFKSLGCKDALYLDGYVSSIFLPDKGINSTDDNFGVMIGVTKNQ